jgi:hypothetical protein
MRTEKWTDMTKLRVAFRNFAGVPKTLSQLSTEEVMECEIFYQVSTFLLIWSPIVRMMVVVKRAYVLFYT